MRTSLERYQSFARREPRLSDDERERFSHDLEGELEERARTAGTGVSAERRVYAWQQQKQALMDELKRQFQRIDHGLAAQEAQPEDLPARFEDGLFVVAWHEQTAALTLGQLVADAAWDIHYALDPASAPKRAQKRYAFERMKARIRELMEEQIAVHEDLRPDAAGRGFHLINLYARRGSEQTGFLAERFVFSLLKQMQYDAGVDVRVEQADIEQDMRQKIDLLIRVPERLRGVQITTSAQLGQRKHIQLMTLGEIRDKMHEADARPADGRLDDRVLVVLEGQAVRSAYGQWIKDGKPPGGPLLYLSEAAAGQAIDVCLKDLVSPHDLERVHATRTYRLNRRPEFLHAPPNKDATEGRPRPIPDVEQRVRRIRSRLMGFFDRHARLAKIGIPDWSALRVGMLLERLERVRQQRRVLNGLEHELSDWHDRSYIRSAAEHGLPDLWRGFLALGKALEHDETFYQHLLELMQAREQAAQGSLGQKLRSLTDETMRANLTGFLQRTIEGGDWTTGAHILKDMREQAAREIAKRVRAMSDRLRQSPHASWQDYNGELANNMTKIEIIEELLNDIEGTVR